MGRAEIFRIEPDQTTRIIAFDLGKALAGDAEANLALQAGDKLAIYSPEQAQRRRKVSIGGCVTRPGTWKPARVSTRGRTSPENSATALVPRRPTVSARTGRTSSVGVTWRPQASRLTNRAANRIERMAGPVNN